MKIDFDEWNDDGVIEFYGEWLAELRRRGILRTKNIVGDVGEYKVIGFYNNSPSLLNLQPADVGTKLVDAINEDGERYNIKATTTKGTGVFNGLNDIGSDLPQEQVFEYVVIIQFNNSLQVEMIYELDWKDFLLLKIWHRGKRTWYLNITNKLKRKAKILYAMDKVV